MVLRAALLASMTDSEKSVKNLVNDTNLRLAGLLLPHQSIGEEVTQREANTPEDPQFEEAFTEEAHYGEPVFEEPGYFGVDEPIYVRTPVGRGGVNIREPSEVPVRRTADEGDARGKKKGPAPEQFEVDSSEDEGINYSTLLDSLSIPEDLFSGIYPFNLASSVDSIARDCSYSFDWDSLDAGSLSVCSHHCSSYYCFIHTCLFEL